MSCMIATEDGKFLKMIYNENESKKQKLNRWHKTIIVNSIINFNELCTIASRTSKHVRFLTHTHTHYTHQQQQHKIEAANAEFEFAVLKNNEM